MTIELYELQDHTGRRYSVYSWRTRMALAHKACPFESRPVKVSDKATIAFSGQTKVPIIRDGETVVFDSMKIAEYLERRYPDSPSLFGGEAGLAFARFFNSWADRQLIGTLFPSLMLENVQKLEADDAAHVRGTIERIAKSSLEELAAGKERAIQAFNRLLDPVRSVLRAQRFVSGSVPRYPDHILFSVFQWPRIVSPTPIIANDDPLQGWFDRMLDLFDGMGRKELPAR